MSNHWADTSNHQMTTLASIHRYPVKSMMGEELNASFVSEKGVLGDRAFALKDEEGKLVTAKNPRKWPTMFSHRASFALPLALAPTDALPPVMLTLPDGSAMMSGDLGLEEALSKSLGKRVTWETIAPEAPVIEEFWPDDVEGLPHSDTVTDENTLAGTFFDLSTIHLLSTGTIRALMRLLPGSRLEARRFRPNFMVDTGDTIGFIENDWVGKTLRIGEVEMEITGPCPRCVMTTLAQYDLPKDSAVLRAAVQANDGGVGVYARILKAGVMRRGDAIEFMG